MPNHSHIAVEICSQKEKKTKRNGPHLCYIKLAIKESSVLAVSQIENPNASPPCLFRHLLDGGVRILAEERPSYDYSKIQNPKRLSKITIGVMEAHHVDARYGVHHTGSTQCHGPECSCSHAISHAASTTRTSLPAASPAMLTYAYPSCSEIEWSNAVDSQFNVDEASISLSLGLLGQQHNPKATSSSSNNPSSTLQYHFQQNPTSEDQRCVIVALHIGLLSPTSSPNSATPTTKPDLHFPLPFASIQGQYWIFSLAQILIRPT
ncbi:hypothetical protein Fmac_011069 [Flemingia macrophylla]|uniref:Uncharacterized protein n=1 Tax=Flemingia macrophylla TaxID=520843 RepID=A0ABD1MLD9_9FABA